MCECTLLIPGQVLCNFALMWLQGTATRGGATAVRVAA